MQRQTSQQHSDARQSQFSSVAAGEAEDRQRAMQRTVDEMQVSLSEREAEIIRLNLCLGDEKKKNKDSTYFNELIYKLEENWIKYTENYIEIYGYDYYEHNYLYNYNHMRHSLI